MRFVPNYDFQVITERDYEEQLRRVDGLLEACKETGTFSAFDQIRLSYVYYLAQDPKANVVIVHGLGEFAKKFSEIIYYFLQQGYNVFIYDQRGHGLSDRLIEDRGVRHVHAFTDYVTDLEQFVEEVVLPTQDLPVYLYAHSMGCAVSLLYMERRPDRVAKAALSAPMIIPSLRGAPLWLARAGVALGKCFLGAKKPFYSIPDFDPNAKHDPNLCTSPARFYHLHRLRVENADYRSAPITFGWAYEALGLQRKLLSKSFLARLKAPVLLISAEWDKVVEISYQKEFARKYSGCRFVQIEEEYHALHACKDSHMEKIFRQIFAFYSA